MYYCLIGLPITMTGVAWNKTLYLRHRRSFDLMNGAPIYIDAIGVPRGVHEEFKLVDQIAGGFKCIFLWITLKKRIDQINYIV